MGISGEADEKTIKKTYLYVGVNPKSQGSDVIASFSGQGMIPIGWYFLFSPDDVVSRNEEFPGELSKYDDKSESLDTLEQFFDEPVAFKTTLPDAKARLAQYKEVLQSIPYLWSYLKVIENLDAELEKYIHQLEDRPVIPVMPKKGPHPETKLSQVEIKKSEAIDNGDNPFAALAQLGAEDMTTPDDSSSEGEDVVSFSDNDLLAALEEAAALDFEVDETHTDEMITKAPELDMFMPVIVYFDEIAIDGRGTRIGRIPLLLERLLHHARREGEMTRIMQDLLQEIFREAQSGWRITGQLAEDFVQGNPSELSSIMLGDPSPFVIIKDALDLEYWTTGTLQSGDERLMYSLTMLPSEEIHKAIKSGKLEEISDDVGNFLITTQGVDFPRLTVDVLKRPSIESNIWGFRVLIKDLSGEYKAATLLISDPKKSWEQEFEDNINLPGVLEDWNVDFTLRFEEYSDIDKYQVIFEGARDMEETFHGFVRWVRRHHLMYIRQFGVVGTINKLKSMLEGTQDKQLGQLLFDILTKLTELGFNPAIDALSDDAIVRKLPWLYS